MYIVKLDKLLSTLESGGGTRLNIEIVSDIIEINSEIVKYIFDCYCKMGILNKKEYIICPEESGVLGEIDLKSKLPLRVFCDICGTDHVITEEDVESRYLLNDFRRDPKGDLEDPNEDETKEKEITSSDLKLENFFIETKKISIVRVAAVQLNYEVSETFPPKVNNGELVREKIFRALKEATSHDVKIICFPELCLYEEWLNDIKQNYPNITVVAGSYYDQENHNICKLLTHYDIEIPHQIKIRPSEFEDSVTTGIGMNSGDKIFIYETYLGKISILICRDFGNFIGQLSNKIDFAFVPSYNQSPDRFEEIAQSHVSNHPTYIIISNASKFGGTSIFGQIDRAHLKRLEQAGCREGNSHTFELCQIKRGNEGMIIADFNIDFKGVQKPTPIDPSEVIRSVIKIKTIRLEDEVD